MANEVKITVDANTKNAQSSLNSFKKNLEGMGATARKAGAGLSAVGAAGLLAIKGFASAAMTQRQAVAQLEVAARNQGIAFGDVEEKVMRVTAALQKKTNFGDEVQIQALAQLLPMFGDMDTALAALPAVMDVAASKGMGMTQAVDSVGRALAGASQTVRGTTIAFEAQQGPMERINQLLGDFGGTAESQADPMIQLANAMGDFSEVIGEQLLPLVHPFIEFLQKFAERLQTVNPEVLRTAVLIGAIGTAVGLTLGPLLLLIGTAIPLLIKGFALLKFATIGWTAALMANPVVFFFKLILAAAVGFFIAYSKNMFGIRDITEKIFVNVVNTIETALNFMIRAVKKTISTFSFLFPESIEKSAAAMQTFDFQSEKAFKNFDDTIRGIIPNAMDTIKNFLVPVTEAADEFDAWAASMNDKAIPGLEDLGKAAGDADVKINDLRESFFGLTKVMEPINQSGAGGAVPGVGVTAGLGISNMAAPSLRHGGALTMAALSANPALASAMSGVKFIADNLVSMLGVRLSDLLDPTSGAGLLGSLREKGLIHEAGEGGIAGLTLRRGQQEIILSIRIEDLASDEAFRQRILEAFIDAEERGAIQLRTGHFSLSPGTA